MDTGNNDITKRLAELSELIMNCVPLNDSDFTDIDEAITEIERLRKELTERIHMCDMRSEKILELTTERDEARKMYCEVAAMDESGYVKPIDMRHYAESCGWDCFKEDGK